MDARRAPHQNIEALTNYDSDEFICKFLAMVKNVTGVLNPNVGGKLTHSRFGHNHPTCHKHLSLLVFGN